MKWRKVVWWTSKALGIILLPVVMVATVLIIFWEALERYDG